MGVIIDNHKPNVVKNAIFLSGGGVGVNAPSFQGTAPVMPVCSFHTRLIRAGLAEFSGYAWVEHLVRISTCTNSVILISLWT